MGRAKKIHLASLHSDAPISIYKPVFCPNPSPIPTVCFLIQGPVTIKMRKSYCFHFTPFRQSLQQTCLVVEILYLSPNRSRQPRRRRSDRTNLLSRYFLYQTQIGCIGYGIAMGCGFRSLHKPDLCLLQPNSLLQLRASLHEPGFRDRGTPLNPL